MHRSPRQKSRAALSGFAITTIRHLSSGLRDEKTKAIRGSGKPEPRKMPRSFRCTDFPVRGKDNIDRRRLPTTAGCRAFP